MKFNKLCATLIASSATLTSWQVHAMSEAPVPISDDYKAMTFNIRDKEPSIDAGNEIWKNRFGSVIRSIQANQPDFVGTQEGYHSQLQSLDTGYHHIGGKIGVSIIELWNNTETKLGDDYARIGQGDDGLTIGKHNAIYYNKTRFEILEKGNRWYSFKGLKDNALAAAVEKGIAEIAINVGTKIAPILKNIAIDFAEFENRMFTYAKVLDKGTNRELWLFNTQMYENKRPEDAAHSLVVTAARTFAINQLRKFMFEKAMVDGQLQPVVLMGNFGANYLNLPMSIALSALENGQAINDDYFRLNARWWALGTLPDDSESYHAFGNIAGQFGKPVYPVDWTYSGGKDAEGTDFRRIKSIIDKNKYLGYANGEEVFPSDHYPIVSEYTFTSE
ncbi:MAG: hypothetical protein HRU08_00285 [Oleispira sp.]|nr:hypothetical protein [Oleispira sp.]